MLSTGLAALSVAVALVAILAHWVYQNVFLNPLRILRKLKSQSVPGYSFIPVFGQIPQILQADFQRDADPAYAAATGGNHFWELGTARFGHVWTFAIGSNICLAVSDPDIIRQICITENDKFVRQPFLKRALWLVGSGLLLSDGEHWKRQRRLISPSLSMREVKRFIPLMCKSTNEAVARWRAAISASKSTKDDREGAKTKGATGTNPSSHPLMMSAELAELTMEVVFRSVLGTQVNQVLDSSRAQALQRAITQHFPNSMQAEQLAFMLPFYRLLPTEINRIVNETSKIIREDLHRVISARISARQATRQSDSEATDLLGLLIEATDVSSTTGDVSNVPGEVTFAGDGTTGQICAGNGSCPVAHKAPKGEAHKRTKQEGARMTLTQLMDECTTLFTAGSETTANFLTWGMKFLSEHEDWQAKAREEVLEFCKRRVGAWDPGFEDLNEMKVLNCVLNEALRLMPPAPIITRTCAEQVRVSKDLVIPEGCDIYIHIEAMHKSKDFWGPDALEFKPERFAKGISEASVHKGAFMPFSMGPRNCVGQNFAQVEAKIIMGAMLKNFTWKVHESYAHHPESLVTMQAKHGLPVVLTSIE